MNPPRRGTPDFLFLFLTFLLVCFGLAMVFSASSMMTTFSKQDPWFFTKKQIFSVLAGTIGMFICMNIHFIKLKKFVIPSFFVVLFMLMLVPFVGQNINGARSWFWIGSFAIQPTEFAKLSIILYLGNLISKKQDKFRDFQQGLLPVLLIVGFIALLIMLQPDLGSCMILLLGAATVIIVGGANLKHLFLLGLGFGSVGTAGIALYIIKNKDNYRIDRFITFLNPWSDPMGSGYQLIQSLYAFGHGGLMGAGFGQGIQKLHYLPEPHNDFIFSIIGEELGFIGSSIFLLVYLLFIWRGLLISVRCTDTFGTLVGVGIMGVIGFQAFINIGGVTGSIPLTGVTLPLISYGGSSMMATLISIGILLSISREHNRVERQAKRT